MKWIWACIAIIVGVAAFVFLQKKPEEVAAAHSAMHDHDHEDHDENHIDLSERQIEQLELTFQTAAPGSLFLKMSTRGKIILHPDHLAHIIPKTSGIAKEAYKNIGNKVKKDEVVAVLESRDMVDVKAYYLAALSREKLAASILAREQMLMEEKISAGQDYLNAKNGYEEAAIQLQLSEQKLKAFGLTEEEIKDLKEANQPDLRRYEIRSPIDGTVIQRHITQGEYIETSSTIYEVADLSTVWVEIGIYPQDLYRVKEGQVVEVSLPMESKKAAAKIIYVSPIVSDETITAKAVAELNNSDQQWRPGVFVTVNIDTEEVSLPVIVSKEAIQTIGGEEVVFVVTDDGFEKREVKTGNSDEKNIEIISGLNPGEKIASSKTFLLKAELGKGSAEHEH